MNIIGIAGRARSGKDTVAEYLVEAHGFHRRAWADSLKDAARAIFGLDDEQLHGGLKDVVDGYWRVSPRVIMQKLGTECLRRGYDEDVWIRSLYKHISSHPLSWPWVVPDVRFKNEARAIRDWGGRLWLVERADVEEVGIKDHASEHDLDTWTDWDAVIANTATIVDLLSVVEGLL